ncbi:hypothetical protein [Brevibacillus choshinensis]|uniref:Restriction endonuclease n=1 Tax=Brevibacillus choshinensis TaxID=54911 RepID=A0ABX7FRS2_BRECH|nr:hypothetical protein [Brevibacillus choshinensis]QRG68304.1 hypothetical protein JNE38_03770 [Brevibacillus choshinensis]
MSKNIDNNLLLFQAYQMLKKDLERPEFQHIESTATKFLHQLQYEIQEWDGISNKTTFDKYWTAPEANAVSAEGIAKMNKSNFTELFLKDAYTQDKVRQLLFIRQQESLDFRLVKKIADVGLIEHLDKYPFSFGKKPLFYVHRLEIMIFPELVTSIADRKKLEDTAKELGINGNSVGFEKLQYQIREKIDTFIQENSLESESDFVKRGIAWWAIDAAKAIRKK